jgi:hypothetical protein
MMNDKWPKIKKSDVQIIIISFVSNDLNCIFNRSALDVSRVYVITTLLL